EPLRQESIENRSAYRVEVRTRRRHNRHNGNAANAGRARRRSNVVHRINRAGALWAADSDASTTGRIARGSLGRCVTRNKKCPQDEEWTLECDQEAPSCCDDTG